MVVGDQKRVVGGQNRWKVVVGDRKRVVGGQNGRKVVVGGLMGSVIPGIARYRRESGAGMGKIMLRRKEVTSIVLRSIAPGSRAVFLVEVRNTEERRKVRELVRGDRGALQQGDGGAAVAQPDHEDAHVGSPPSGPGW